MPPLTGGNFWMSEGAESTGYTEGVWEEGTLEKGIGEIHGHHEGKLVILQGTAGAGP